MLLLIILFHSSLIILTSPKTFGLPITFLVSSGQSQPRRASYYKVICSIMKNILY